MKKAGLTTTASSAIEETLESSKLYHCPFTAFFAHAVSAHQQRMHTPAQSAWPNQENHIIFYRKSDKKFELMLTRCTKAYSSCWPTTVK